MGKSDYAKFSSDSYPIKEIDSCSIAIVRTEWNTEVIDLMVSSCKKQLVEAGVDLKNVCDYRVPGSFELPMGAKMVLASQLKPDAVICLGCVIKGETQHDVYINQAISAAIAHLNVISGVPVIFGVLTPNNMEQAVERANGDRGDKGAEAAIAALKMISLKEKLANQGKKISFR